MPLVNQRTEGRKEMLEPLSFVHVLDTANLISTNCEAIMSARARHGKTYDVSRRLETERSATPMILDGESCAATVCEAILRTPRKSRRCSNTLRSCAAAV